MTDLELLAYAATAAGYNVEPYTWSSGTEFEHHGFRYDSEAECQSEYEWNPLEDDGDALRLAVKLRINIEHVASMNRNENFVSTWPSGRGDCGFMEPVLGDYAAATRRAIVRAAAEIGKTR